MSKVEDSFNILSGDAGKVTLKIEQAKLQALPQMPTFSSGVERLNYLEKKLLRMQRH